MEERGEGTIADVLPDAIASVTTSEQLEAMRQKLLEMPEPDRRAFLTKEDWLGAIAICLLVFFSTFPVVIPLLIVSDAWLALRISNGIAILMLASCDYAFGRYSGLRPWATALATVAIGAGLAGMAIALLG
jgi:VIT1/CCC1 family predicted Fe2+/Mn2+ transporter